MYGLDIMEEYPGVVKMLHKQKRVKLRQDYVIRMEHYSCIPLEVNVWK